MHSSCPQTDRVKTSECLVESDQKRQNLELDRKTNLIFLSDRATYTNFYISVQCEKYFPNFLLKNIFDQMMKSTSGKTLRSNGNSDEILVEIHDGISGLISGKTSCEKFLHNSGFYVCLDRKSYFFIEFRGKFFKISLRISCWNKPKYSKQTFWLFLPQSFGNKCLDWELRNKKSEVD